MKLSLIKVGCAILASTLLISCSSVLKYEPRNGSIKKNHCTKTYKVVQGDTLSGIAYDCGVSMQGIATLNKLLPPYFIYIEQKLKLPVKLVKIRNKIVKTTAQVWSPKTASAKAVRQIKLKKQAFVRTKKSIPWGWPTNQQLSYRFIRDDAGISILEIYGLPGQAVMSVASGKVVYAGRGMINYGWMVVVKHDDGYMSVYAHNSNLMVKIGDRVRRGEPIATLGITGNTTNPKLYLEARYQGRKVDVRKILEKI